MKHNDGFPDEDLLRSNIAGFEKHIIVSALKRASGNQTAAAKMLGTTARIINYRVRKYGIDISQFRN